MKKVDVKIWKQLISCFCMDLEYSSKFRCLITIHKLAIFIPKLFFPTTVVRKLNTKFMADGLNVEFMGVGHEDANTRVR